MDRHVLGDHREHPAGAADRQRQPLLAVSAALGAQPRGPRPVELCSGSRERRVDGRGGGLIVTGSARDGGSSLQRCSDRASLHLGAGAQDDCTVRAAVLASQRSAVLAARPEAVLELTFELLLEALLAAFLVAGLLEALLELADVVAEDVDELAPEHDQSGDPQP